MLVRMVVNFEKAAELLRLGEVIGIPTETVYGLAGNALDPNAVAQIFSKKQRPTFHPLIVHDHSMEAAFRWAASVPDEALVLAQAFWPGPLTIVLPKKDIPDLVTGGLDGVGLRVPAHPLTRKLIKTLGFPLAAPSANSFGRISPTTAAHVTESLAVPVLDGGPCGVGLESTILGWMGNQFRVLRLGGLSLEAIEAKIGPLERTPPEKAIAPGMLKAHYQPITPMRFREKGQLPDRDGLGLLTLNESGEGFSHRMALSPQGNLEEAAAKFFEALRDLDKCGVKEIWADKMPEVGLGRAINDRLTRACH